MSYTRAATQEDDEFTPMQPSGYRDDEDSRYHRKSYGDRSLKNRVQKTYWLTKQTMIEKLGKEQDEHVVASDSELDQTLEIYKQLHITSLQLLKAVERYQNSLRDLANDEGELSRFVQEQGTNDKTRAGKMMRVVGKSLSYTAQQRLLVRGSLVRLLQEVSTFRQRALSDCALTIQRMQAARTEYRAALLWLKDVSQNLDPDVNKRLDKFRKIQTIVKKSHEKFQNLKYDACQKIELLNASRANLFSQTLAPYQQQIMKFWTMSNRSMKGIVDSFRGYQHYEYRVLKELQEPTPEDLDDNEEAKLGEVQEEDNQDNDEQEGTQEDIHQHSNNDQLSGKVDSLISFDESSNIGNIYNAGVAARPEEDDDPLIGTEEIPAAYINMLASGDASSEQNILPSDMLGTGNVTSDPAMQHAATMGVDGQQQFAAPDSQLYAVPGAQHSEDQEEGNDTKILSDILNNQAQEARIPIATEESNMTDFQKQWQTVFGTSETPQMEYSSDLTNLLSNEPGHGTAWVPSNLLDQSASQGGDVLAPAKSGTTASNSDKPVDKSSGKRVLSKGDPSKMAAWFNLFADLDPLSNPDSIGAKTEEVEERNC